jgi:hypothetical protein
VIDAGGQASVRAFRLTVEDRPALRSSALGVASKGAVQPQHAVLPLGDGVIILK